MTHRSLSLPLILSASLLVAACGGDKKESTWLGTPPPTETSATTVDTAATDTATHPASPGGTAVVPDVGAGTTVIVMLGENTLGVPPESIPKGPAVITAQNGGSEVHNLFVEGPGVSRSAANVLEPGSTATLEVVFQPGTYTFYCPLADHRSKGEEARITIAP